MFEIDELPNDKFLKEISDVISYKIGDKNSTLALITSAYTLTKVASMMHTFVNCGSLGTMPINCYATCIAPSGYGKGYALKILRDDVTNLFNNRFVNELVPTVTQINLQKHAFERSLRFKSNPEDELGFVEAELLSLGCYITQFDSGTNVGLKQLRHLVQLSGIGSLNFEVDEIGSHLLENKEILDTCLELYDGRVLPKLIKNTKDEVRKHELSNITPANVLLLGTGNLLLDGGINERMFKALIAEGYGRRMFFSVSDMTKEPLSYEDHYNKLISKDSETKLNDLSKYLESLATTEHYKREIGLTEESLDILVRYIMHCENEARSYKEKEDIYKLESFGRYFKTLKLAAALAFVNKNDKIEKENLLAAIKVAQISAQCMRTLFTTDSAHVRLAKYMQQLNTPLTHADLAEDLPFYPKTSKNQNDLWKLAIAYGYKNNILIKRTLIDDIEFFEGESVEENNIEDLKAIISYTINPFHGAAQGYKNVRTPYDRLPILLQKADGHWLNHHITDGVRKKENVISGCNLIVLDIDNGTPMHVAQNILKKYAYFLYTTKSHTQEQHRYRIVLPMSHTLNLSCEEYKQFIGNILNFLPINCDNCSQQRSRKWASYEDSTLIKNEGELFDVLPFIPKTKKNDTYLSLLKDSADIDRLERYFMLAYKNGSRNNTLYNYAMLLVDSGYLYQDISKRVNKLNRLSENPLPQAEVNTMLSQEVFTSLKKEP